MRKRLALYRLRFLRTWYVMVLLAATGTGLGWVWWSFDLFSIHDDERGAYDDGLKAFTNKPWFPPGITTPSADILVVAIDDASIDAIRRSPTWSGLYGTWPWSRGIYAQLASMLAAAGARALVFDAIIDVPKPLEDLELAQGIRDAGLPFYLGFSLLARQPPLPVVDAGNRLGPVSPFAPEAPDAGPPSDDGFPDDAFEAADPTKDAPELLPRTAQAFAFPVTVSGGLSVPSPEPEQRTVRVRPECVDAGLDVGPDGGSCFEPLEEATVEQARTYALGPVPAAPELLEVMSGFGGIQAEVDEDGKMRRTQFVFTDGNNSYAMLPVAVAADLAGAASVELSPGALTLGSKVVHINPDGTAELNYRGRLYERFPILSVVDVLARAGAVEKLKPYVQGRVVILGGFALGTADQKPTPFEQLTPGLVKQAVALDNLLNDRFILEVPFWVSLLFGFVVALISVTLIMVFQSVVLDIGAPVFLYFFFYLVTGGVAVAFDLHVLSAMPGMAGTLASVAATAFNRFFASKDREQLRALFGNYMESDLVDQMVEQRALPKLDGESMVVTAFFSDIKGFSTFSEKFRGDPKGLMRLLNRYLSAVTPVLTAQGACIDKYIGDAVVALFGAPVRFEDHALRACRAALAVQEAIGRLREAFKAEGLPDVYTRVGLNTDEMLVGNIGSDQLLDYTAIGDGMNLAARLEGANKQYGTLIMMGPGTYARVKEHVEARELDSIRVAGKALAVTVYELLGMKGTLGPVKRGTVKLYAQALALYRARSFVEASALLNQALAVDPTDGPCSVLLERCAEFAVTPPPADWDGVSSLEK